MLFYCLLHRIAGDILKLRGELVDLPVNGDYGVIWSTFFLPDTTAAGTVLLTLVHKIANVSLKHVWVFVIVIAFYLCTTAMRMS